MKSKIIITILGLTLLLSACKGEETGEISRPDTPAATDENHDPSAASYQNLYAQLVNDIPDNTAVFSLIYLDNDDVPELVIYDESMGCYSIYTTRDHAPLCMAESLFTVELTYYERKGILCSFARWNGGGDEGGYGESFYPVSSEEAITDDTVPFLSYSYNAVYDDNGSYTGEGITSYYHMGQEVDEASYTELMTGLDISQDQSRPCLENAAEKEEILRQLNQ